MTEPLVGIVMGVDSDWSVMALAAEALQEFEVPYEVTSSRPTGCRTR